jgi:hypothetical protein
MAKFIQRYREYRRVGHSRASALRFAWMVINAPGGSLQVR